MNERPASVPFGEALRWWFRLGCISFGGPAGQIAIMHRELVEQRRWISERRFLHALNYCMVLPGPEAQQLATYIGYLMHGTRGAIAAGALFVLPSLLLIVALAWLYMAFGHLPALQSVLWAIKPAVAAIVAHAAWRIGSRTLKHPLLWALAAGAFVALLFAVPFPLVIGMAAVAGIVAARTLPGAFAAGHGHAAANSQPHAPALIDDDTPVPAHARWSRARFLLITGFFLGLWMLVLGALALLLGWGSTLTDMALFFSKAALLTFGGAYAVLPYVTDAAVNVYGWATLPQVMDGLALGESTPGPLIMFVSFVGFVGGWTQDALAPLTGTGLAWAGGIAGALVATLFTFLPSFLFILAGAPLVEATRTDLRIGAPLTAITAAVVGVIASLAVFFGLHVLWPAGTDGGPDIPALLIALLAFVALWRFNLSVPRLVAACALVGLLRALL